MRLGSGESVACCHNRPCVASSLDELKFQAKEDPPFLSREGWSESKSSNRLSRFELRRANDGNWYTKCEFANFYSTTMPTTWPKKWDQAGESIPPRLSREKGLFLTKNGYIDEQEEYLGDLVPPPPRQVRRTRWLMINPESVDEGGGFEGTISDDEAYEVEAMPKSVSALCVVRSPVAHVSNLKRTDSSNPCAVRMKVVFEGDDVAVINVGVKNVTPTEWLRLPELDPLGMRSPRTAAQESATRITGAYRENEAKDHPVDPLVILENYCEKNRLPKPTYKNVNEPTHMAHWRSTLIMSETETLTSVQTYSKSRSAEREVAIRYMKLMGIKCADKESPSSSAQALATICEEPPNNSPHAMHCKFCDLWLNGPDTFAEHVKGKKHIKVSKTLAAQLLTTAMLADATVGVEGADFSKLQLEGYITHFVVMLSNFLTKEVADVSSLYNHYQANMLSGLHFFLFLLFYSTVFAGILLIIIGILGYFMYDNTVTTNSAFKADAEVPKCLRCSKDRFANRDHTGTRVFHATSEDRCTVVKTALMANRCGNCSRFPRSYGSEPVRFYADEASSKLMHVFSTYRQGEQLDSEKQKAPKNYNSSITGALSAMPNHSDNMTTFSQILGGINSQQHMCVRSGFLPFATWCHATDSYMQATAWHPIPFVDGKAIPEERTLYPQGDSYSRVRKFFVKHMPYLFAPSDLPPIPGPSAPPPDDTSSVISETDTVVVPPSTVDRIRNWFWPSSTNEEILHDFLTQRGNRPQMNSLHPENEQYDEERPRPPPTPPTPPPASPTEYYDISDPRARILPPPGPPPRQSVGRNGPRAVPIFDENSTAHLSEADRHQNLVNSVEFFEGAVPSIARTTLEIGGTIKSCCNLSPPGLELPNGSIPTSGLQFNADANLVATGLITGLDSHHVVYPASQAPCLASEIEKGAKIVFTFDKNVGQTCVACGPIVSQPTVWNAADPFARIQALEHRIEVDVDPRCYCFKKCKCDTAGARQCGEGTDGKCCACAGELVGKAYEIRALYHKRATTLCAENNHRYCLSGCISCDPCSAARPTAAYDIEARHCLDKILLGQKVHDSELAILFPDGYANDDYDKNEYMSKAKYDEYKGERKKFLDFIRQKPTPQQIKEAVKWAKENLDIMGDGRYPVCSPGKCPNGQALAFRAASATGRRYTSLWSNLSAKNFSFSRQREAFNLAFQDITDITDVFKHTKFSPEEIEKAVWNLKMLIGDESQMQNRTGNSKAEVIVGKECKPEDLLKNRKKYNKLTSDTKKNKARLVYDNGIELMVLSYVVTKIFQILLYSKEMGIFYQYSIKEQDREETVNRHLKKMMADTSVDGKIKWLHQACMAELDQTGWERHQKAYKGRRKGLMTPIIGILRNICKNLAHFSPVLGELATLYDNKIGWDIDHGLIFDLKVPCIAKKGKTHIRVVLPELQVDSGWTNTSGCNAAAEITGVLCSAFSNPQHVLCQAGENDKRRQKGEFHMQSLPDVPGTDERTGEFCMKWGGHTFNDTFQTVDLYWEDKFQKLVSEFLAMVEGDDFAARMHRAFADPRNAAIFENNQADLGASAKWKTIVNGRLEMIGIHAPVVNGRPVADGAGMPFWVPDLTKSLTKLGCKVGTDNSKVAQMSRFAALAGIYYKKILPLGTIFRNAAINVSKNEKGDIGKALVTVKEYDELHRAGFSVGKHPMQGILDWMHKECQGNMSNVTQEVMLMNTSMREDPYPKNSPIDNLTWAHLLNAALATEDSDYRDSVQIYNMLPPEMRPKFQ